MNRPDIDQYFINMAKLVASRGTCTRRKVGCVIVDYNNHVLSTGYNGPAAGQAHCIEQPCKGANYPSGEGLEFCEAIHAEANALLQCPDVNSIWKLYCTTSPCVHCVKLLLNTSCHAIIFEEGYPHSDSQELWERSKRKWIQFRAPE